MNYGLILLPLALLALIYLFVILLSHSPRPPLPSEKLCTNGSDPSIQQPLPDLNSPGEIAISVVVPCYNEAERLGTMLAECVPVLNSVFGNNGWEILFVDDGSTDATAEYALGWAQAHAKVQANQFRVTSLIHNRGKGGAVVHGMCHCRGNLLIFADADGASKFSDIEKLIAAINGRENAIAIGSRAHLVKTEAVVKRSFIRNLLMYGLHTLLYIFGIRTIRDTQCGFKLFTRKAAMAIFPYMHTEGWIFDVEVLILAAKKDIPVEEVAISWHEVAGSKIELAKDSIRMAIDLIIMRVAYLLGIYNAYKMTVDRTSYAKDK